jgi:hypothetical protein
VNGRKERSGRNGGGCGARLINWLLRPVRHAGWPRCIFLCVCRYIHIYIYIYTTTLKCTWVHFSSPMHRPHPPSPSFPPRPAPDPRPTESDQETPLSAIPHLRQCPLIKSPSGLPPPPNQNQWLRRLLHASDRRTAPRLNQWLHRRFRAWDHHRWGGTWFRSRWRLLRRLGLGRYRRHRRRLHLRRRHLLRQ